MPPLNENPPVSRLFSQRCCTSPSVSVPSPVQSDNTYQTCGVTQPQATVNDDKRYIYRHTRLLRVGRLAIADVAHVQG